MKYLTLFFLVFFGLISCTKITRSKITGSWQFERANKLLEIVHESDPSLNYSIELEVENGQQHFTQRNSLGQITLDSTVEFMERKMLTLKRNGSFHSTYYNLLPYLQNRIESIDTKGSWSFLSKNEATNNEKNDRIYFLGSETIWKVEEIQNDSIILRNYGETTVSGANPTTDTYYNTSYITIIELTKTHLKVESNTFPSGLIPNPNSAYSYSITGYEQFKKL